MENTPKRAGFRAIEVLPWALCAGLCLSCAYTVDGPQYNRRLMGAVGHCDVHSVEMLTQSGKANVKVRDDAGRTPLALACISDCDDVAAILIERGSDVHASDDMGATPLMLAAANNSVDCLAILLQHDPDFLATRLDGVDALQLAAANGSVDCLTMLLEAGADPERFTAGARRTALMMAAQHGCARCVTLLLEAGANRAHEDRSGRTATDIAQEALVAATTDEDRAAIAACLDALQK